MPTIDLRDKTETEIITIMDSNGFAYPKYKKHNRQYGVHGSSGADANTFSKSLRKLLPHIPHDFLID